MNSFTKDTINTHSRKRQPKLKKSDYYIYKLHIVESAKYFKAAGGVGGKIYEYLKWKKEMNGNKLISLPNNYFDSTWGIKRQRTCEAIDKLGAAGLIKIEKKKGRKTLVKLND